MVGETALRRAICKIIGHSMLFVESSPLYPDPPFLFCRRCWQEEDLA